jgi:hypothetical protein
MANPRRIFTQDRLRSILYSFLLVAVSIATLALIGFSHAIAQQTVELSAAIIANRADISTVSAAQPGTTPSCSPPCVLPVVLSENFDSVTAPALPTDWLATNALGPPPLWVTSNSGVPIPPSDTPPNAAFVDDPDVVSDKRLDSLHFPVGADGAQLTFRQTFNLEASDVDPNLGFDGGVLEVSFDGGNTFQDILDAGGSFEMSGYNRTISTDRGSPIAGRQAWSGNSKGFVTTVVNLPFIPPGGRLRWRMASDNNGSNEGWRVDTVFIAWCEPVPCGTPTPPITPTPTATSTVTATPRVTPRARPTPHTRPTPP